jgi:hypothetical protein
MTSTDLNETIAFRRGWLRLKYLAAGVGLIAVAVFVLYGIYRREFDYGTHDWKPPTARRLWASLSFSAKSTGFPFRANRC